MRGRKGPTLLDSHVTCGQASKQSPAIVLGEALDALPFCWSICQLSLAHRTTPHRGSLILRPFPFSARLSTYLWRPCCSNGIRIGSIASVASGHNTIGRLSIVRSLSRQELLKDKV